MAGGEGRGQRPRRTPRRTDWGGRAGAPRGPPELPFGQRTHAVDGRSAGGEGRRRGGCRGIALVATAEFVEPTEAGRGSRRRRRRSGARRGREHELHRLVDGDRDLGGRAREPHLFALLDLRERRDARHGDDGDAVALADAHGEHGARRDESKIFEALKEL